jgi:hypothetical protein
MHLRFGVATAELALLALVALPARPASFRQVRSGLAPLRQWVAADLTPRPVVM